MIKTSAYEVSGLSPQGFDFYRRRSTKTFFGVSVLVFPACFVQSPGVRCDQPSRA